MTTIVATCKNGNVVMGADAQVTDNADTQADDKLIMKWRGENIVDIDRDFLDMAGAKRRIEKIKINVKDNLNVNPIPTEIRSALEKNDIE